MNILTDLTGIHDGYTSQSSLYLFFSQLPDVITLYLWLCIQLNLSVALLNMLPVSILDGGLTSPQFARLLFPKNWQRLSKITEFYGMFLLGGNLLVGLIPLILNLPSTAAAGAVAGGGGWGGSTSY
jgi:Zn-dependent protease